MAMIDYGAVVKKNGKIISDPNGGLFQNFTGLACEYDEDGKMIKDETLATNFRGETISLGESVMALVGDSKLMLGFYKTYLIIYLNKEYYDYTFEYYGTRGCVLYRPYTFNVKDKDEVITTVTINRVFESQVLLATFKYNGDTYEVLYGYGIDPSLAFTFSEKNYYHHKKKCHFSYHYTWHNAGGYKYRKLLKFIRHWTYDGLSDEDRERVTKVYKYYD